jgi:hypothetical protein
MRAKPKNFFFHKLRDLLTLPVDLGSVLRELFVNDRRSFSEILHRNSKPWKLAHGNVHYVRGWIILIKP